MQPLASDVRIEDRSQEERPEILWASTELNSTPNCSDIGVLLVAGVIAV